MDLAPSIASIFPFGGSNKTDIRSLRLGDDFDLILIMSLRSDGDSPCIALEHGQTRMGLDES